MNKEKSPWDWNKQYRSLLEGAKSSPPAELTSLIKKRIDLDLNPSGRSVFFKLFVIHFVSGALTLFVWCSSSKVRENGKSLTLRQHEEITFPKPEGIPASEIRCQTFGNRREILKEY